ncbi:hypothetical protein BUALT_Bualt18G0024400 [Buddleja alternifolia]|uniref:Retrotransposon gag domain-containing protein n=1 Tax=Buddleja alternifolia TaxID=168488 RepID=A0AAV6W8B1_9LAMI|nr:hypothetical protein BUALT_Bualt18G0024400 [Buddleja alternifolia]
MQSSMDQRHETMDATIVDLQNQISSILSSSSVHTPPPPPSFAYPPNTQHLHHTAAPSHLFSVPSFKPPKLDMQPFDGTNPLDWIFQADQYFTYYHIPPDQHMDIIPFYMKGAALSWYKWMYHNRKLSSWEALELRFGPSTFDNHQVSLFKLRQVSSVTEYQAEFERLYWSSHLFHVSQALQLLLGNSFYAKFLRCHFGVPSVDYLGHVISGNGVAADPSKLQAIRDWPAPHNLTTLRGFLGLTGYYCRFVRHYATIASPLIDLLESTTFTWTTSAATAFLALKEAMISLPATGLEINTQAYSINEAEEVSRPKRTTKRLRWLKEFH